MSKDESKRLYLHNDYSCIWGNDTDNIAEIGHYTKSVDAVISIMQGAFWATNMLWFRHPGRDLNEGVLVSDDIHRFLSDNKKDALKYMPESCLKRALEKTQDACYIKELFTEYRTHVVSFCMNTNSTYMWNDYAKNGYELIFDKRAFLDSLSFEVGDKRAGDEIVEKNDPKVFKHAPIIYSNQKQMEQIENFIKDYFGKTNIAPITEDEDVDLFLRHFMFVGNFYKTEEDFKDEEEYRLLVNSASPEPGSTKNVPREYEDEKSKRKYIILSYDPKSIKKILCYDEECKKALCDKLLDEHPPIEVRQ